MKKMKEFNTLKKSEIKKAEKMANKLNGRTDCKVTAYGYNGADEYGFARVFCEICYNYEERADEDVQLEICLWDRRRSWAHAVI